MYGHSRARTQLLKSHLNILHEYQPGHVGIFLRFPLGWSCPGGKGKSLAEKDEEYAKVLPPIQAKEIPVAEWYGVLEVECY